MKVIQIINEKSCVLKLTKKEFEIVQYIIVNDDGFEPNFNVLVHSDTSTCVVTQISDISIDTCIGYFNHCFANEIVSSMIRFDKIKHIRNA